LEFEGGELYEPSLSVDLDYQPNDHFYFHTTFNADRGFDAGSEADGDVRFDTLFLRYRPTGDNTLNFQLGKSPTVVGNWVPEFADNPFLLAPLPYASITGAGTQEVFQLSGQEIENRANAPGATIHTEKTDWSALIWGPAYSNGGSIFGSSNGFDYAFEIKNTSIGSAPDEWDFGEGDFSDPLLAGRIGYRPNAAWAYGLSLSHGPYLDADAILAPGIDRGDLDQTLAVADVRWSRRNLIISGEAFFAEYDRVEENLQVFSYYIQGRYKLGPGMWLAGRFGQTLSNEVAVPSGGVAPWSPDLLRGELAFGWRATEQLSFKTQYTYTEITNDFSEIEPHLFSFSADWSF